MDPAAILKWDFWIAWAESPRPGELLAEIRDAGLLTQLPQLAALPDVKQDPVWHPEGDVWIHTLHVCTAAANISDRERLVGPERQTLLIAALCHDFGKPATTLFSDGRWRRPDIHRRESPWPQNSCVALVLRNFCRPPYHRSSPNISHTLSQI